MGAAHNHDDTPFVLVGGGGGKLITNQLVRFPLNLPGRLFDKQHRRPLAERLLLTLAKVMGVDVGASFGTASYCTAHHARSWPRANAVRIAAAGEGGDRKIGR